MFTVVHAARVLRELWQYCAGCGALFPAAPGETRCATCRGGGWR